ncbi:hypothetical protein M6B38_382100 [Iris pallida]|uniref:Uncharacterized protein n=1 Tax=Iris pallida TaxID=29817 RepID=A0AAX6G7G2_IRIPA|nr:hypothetical protein M6B38_195530 [Iris pallida]KAJ6824552.1 hypothetical protein M6B38_382100 [Iris pallida]
MRHFFSMHSSVSCNLSLSVEISAELAGKKVSLIQ